MLYLITSVKKLYIDSNVVFISTNVVMLYLVANIVKLYIYLLI